MRVVYFKAGDYDFFAYKLEYIQKIIIKRYKNIRVRKKLSRLILTYISTDDIRTVYVQQYLDENGEIDPNKLVYGYCLGKNYFIYVI